MGKIVLKLKELKLPVLGPVLIHRFHMNKLRRLIHSFTRLFSRAVCTGTCGSYAVKQAVTVNGFPATQQVQTIVPVTLVLVLRRDTQKTRTGLSVEAGCRACHSVGGVQPLYPWVPADLSGSHGGAEGLSDAAGITLLEVRPREPLLHAVRWKLVRCLRYVAC